MEIHGEWIEWPIVNAVDYTFVFLVKSQLKLAGIDWKS